MNESQNNTGLSKRQLLAGTVFTVISASALSTPQTPFVHLFSSTVVREIPSMAYKLALYL